MSIYYNEFEPYAAQWLRNLSDARHINPGVVDSRSIREVAHGDVAGATQAHFFAGIGVWSHALRLAGWPDDRAVWTGSCPCQPFSVAGRGKGVDDERHLWPEWFRLIRECRPPVVFGEQVASADGRTWLDAVRADLEGVGYAFGASDLCAAGVGAPHIRQRLYFVGIRLADDGREGRRQVGPDTRGRDEGGRTTRVDKRSLHGGAFSTRGLADASDERFDGRRAGQASDGRDETRLEPERLRDARGLGDTSSARTGRNAGAGPRAQEGAELRAVGDAPLAPGAVGQRLGDTKRVRLEGHAGHGDDGNEPRRDGTQPYGPTPTSGFWGGPDWVYCRDDKYRPVEPGTFPLAHGASARVGKLRAFGNAIVSEVAATFIQAVMEHLDQ